MKQSTGLNTLFRNFKRIVSEVFKCSLYTAVSCKCNLGKSAEYRTHAILMMLQNICWKLITVTTEKKYEKETLWVIVCKSSKSVGGTPPLQSQETLMFAYCSIEASLYPKTSRRARWTLSYPIPNAHEIGRKVCESMYLIIFKSITEFGDFLQREASFG